MLVKFETSAYATITMFEEVAVNLLKLMGQSGRIPGAIKPGDIPAAVNALQKGIADIESSAAGESATDPSDDDNDDAQKVRLGTRAIPLINLLEAAAKEEETVTWKG